MSLVRRVLVLTLAIVFAGGLAAWGEQDQAPSKPSDTPDDRGARATEMSSSKDTRIDLSPPKDDSKAHPQSGGAILDDEGQSGIEELRPWDPHKAAKDVEVGDFYYKRKNYRAALERYKEALIYKPNDAIANFRLAECQEKTGDPSQALAHYQEYLKLLPHGPWAGEAERAITQLKATTAKQSNAN